MDGPDVVTDLEHGISSHGNHSTSVDVSRSKYRRERVELLQRPWLGSLDEFLDPDQKCFAVSEKQQLSFFDIKVIHISKSRNIS
jgi:hypothetical protein